MTAAQRRVLRLAEMRIQRPAIRAAGVFGVHGQSRAAASDRADDLAGAGTLLRGGGARVGQALIIIGIAVRAAGTDGKRAGRIGGGNSRDQDACRCDRERKASQKSNHSSPSPEERVNASGEGLLVGESRWRPLVPREGRSPGVIRSRCLLLD